MDIYGDSGVPRRVAGAPPLPAMIAPITVRQHLAVLFLNCPVPGRGSGSWWWIRRPELDPRPHAQRDPRLVARMHSTTCLKVFGCQDATLSGNSFPVVWLF